MVSSYMLSVLTLICINIVAVAGLSLLTGFTGLFSFGHSGFMSIGAYTAAILFVKFNMPYWAVLPLGGLAACLVSGIMYPTLRLKGDYFAIAALGFGESVRLIMDNGGNLTGGARGFGGMPTLTKWPEALLVAAIALVLMRNIIRSRFGRTLIAIREDKIAAQSMGINVARNQYLALAISAFYCGVAGAMFAFFMTYLQPSMFDVAKSTELSSSVVFGGIGSLSGSVIAAIVLTSIPEIFRPLMQWRMVFYGLALVLTIVVKPTGLMGTNELSFGFLQRFARKVISVGKKNSQATTKPKGGK
ncbi:MAG: branched-chain amino acid ABC transporter permease [Spirochaetales bacterium]